MELRGIEPLTFSMRTRRATNCAIAPSTLADAEKSNYHRAGELIPSGRSGSGDLAFGFAGFFLDTLCFAGLIGLFGQLGVGLVVSR